MTKPRYPALIQSLPSTVPFVGPEVQERTLGKPFLARLGANESVFGPSPRAIDAIARAARDCWQYGDPTNFDLKDALAAKLGIQPHHIVVGEGIDGLLGYLVRLLISEGDAVVTSDGAYPTFNYHVAGFGGTLHKVPYKDDCEDIDALVAKAADVDAKIVYFANPDNPMGSWLPADRIEAACKRLPDGCLLVLDEAYVEFAPDDAVPALQPEDPAIIRMRTFSKGYGMAGMRIGYAIGAAELIQSFDKIRNHFGVSRVAQAAALAALDDQSWLEHVQREVAISKDRIAEIAAANGLTALPSATNFVAIDCGRDGDFARAVLSELIAEGVFVRMPFVAPQDRCIRISTGRAGDMVVLEQALPTALERARKAAD